MKKTNHLFPISKAQLPPVESIMPYLRELEGNGANGALTRLFEERIARHLGLEPGQVTTLANATAGMVLALDMLKAKSDDELLCLMPAFAFPAVPGAAIAAGLTPYFADVDTSTWALTVNDATRAVESAPGRVGAVVVTSPFGSPVDASAWDRFSDEKKVPVIIDAAWGFDGARVTRAATTISLHLEMVLGVGEGGILASRDATLVANVRARANFGLGKDRLAHVPAVNHRFSEVSAAVGLAALDRWPDTRARILNLTEGYLAALRKLDGVHPMPNMGGACATATLPIRFDQPIAHAVVDAMAHEGIECRMWWGRPCNLHPAFAGHPHTDLRHTRDLCQRVLNLPFWPEMTGEDVNRVIEALGRAMAAV